MELFLIYDREAQIYYNTVFASREDAQNYLHFDYVDYANDQDNTYIRSYEGYVEPLEIVQTSVSELLDEMVSFPYMLPKDMVDFADSGIHTERDYYRTTWPNFWALYGKYHVE